MRVISLSRARMYATRWRRLIGSLKLQIIFHKRATKYRSLLREMTYKDKGSYESSPLRHPVGSLKGICMYMTYISMNGCIFHMSRMHSCHSPTHRMSLLHAYVYVYVQVHAHVYKYVYAYVYVYV